jgi:hypothetical protein
MTRAFHLGEKPAAESPIFTNCGKAETSETAVKSPTKITRVPFSTSASNPFDLISPHLDQNFRETVGIKKLYGAAPQAELAALRAVHPDPAYRLTLPRELRQRRIKISKTRYGELADLQTKRRRDSSRRATRFCWFRVRDVAAVKDPK